MAEPLELVAGDTWSWTSSLPDYPADQGWSLAYFFSLPGGQVKTVNATASGSSFAATVAAVDSKNWAPGSYAWTARVSKGGEAHRVGSGWVKVSADPATAAAASTHASRCLAQVEAALESCFTNAAVEFELDGLKVKHNRSELLELRTRYRREVRIERGGSPFAVIRVGFGNA